MVPVAATAACYGRLRRRSAVDHDPGSFVPDIDGATPLSVEFAAPDRDGTAFRPDRRAIGSIHGYGVFAEHVGKLQVR